jgi:hypothetical protein
MNEILERWRPEMIARFSPQGMSAVEEIKAFILDSVDASALDEAALSLAGLSQPAFYATLSEYAAALAQGFADKGLKEKFRGSFTIASADIIRERALAMQSQGAGCALSGIHWRIRGSLADYGGGHSARRRGCGGEGVQGCQQDRKEPDRSRKPVLARVKTRNDSPQGAWQYAIA